MIIMILILIWFPLGFIGSGWHYSYFQGEWPDIVSERERSKYKIESLLWGTTGPIGMIIAYILSGRGKHGWWKSYPNGKYVNYL